MERAKKHRKAHCEICDGTEKLDAHHKDGNIKNNSPENLQTLCHQCHMKLHWKLRKRGIVYGSHTQQFSQSR